MSDEQLKFASGWADEIVRRWFGNERVREIELHAHSVIQGQRGWEEVAGKDRPRVFDEMRDLLRSVKPILFAQILDKGAYRNQYPFMVPETPPVNTLRLLLGRVSRHLKGRREVATITVDDDADEIREAQLALEATIRTHGDRFRRTRARGQPYSVTRIENLDRIVHLDSRSSRGLQLADYVAHFTWRAAEHRKANRMRELDALWAATGPQRDPWVGRLDPEVLKLLPEWTQAGLR